MVTVPNRGPRLQAVGIALVTTALLSTLLRVYTRMFIVKRFGLDDWCMIAALIFFILFVTCALVGVHYGTGRHHWDLEDEEIEAAKKYWWLCYLWYCTAMIASKISIGWFLLRITIRRIDIWIIYSVMLVTVLTGIVFFFVTLFQCNPIAYFWDTSLNGSCIPVEVIIALTYLYSACSVICDFTFALLPMALIWNLNMDRKSKIALVPIMLMACVASSAVVVRFAYVEDFKDPDFLWATVDIAIWSTTEQGLAITAGSLATLRPLLKKTSEALGLSVSGRSEIPDSDDAPHPNGSGLRTFGQSGNSRRHRGPFSLTTFGRDGGSDENVAKENEGENSNTTYVVGGKGALAWTSTTTRERSDNDSEERLAPPQTQQVNGAHF